MEVSRHISVAAPDEDVWKFVSDLPSVLPCIPGAKLGKAVGDGTFEATITVNAGEFSVSFSGTTSIATDGPRTAVISAKGRDKLGTIHAEATIRVNVEREEAASAIDVQAHFDFSGVLAPAARAGGQPAAQLLLKKFASCVATKFAPPE